MELESSVFTEDSSSDEEVIQPVPSNIDEYLPPPKPLIQRTFFASEPAVHAQKISFEPVPTFTGIEQKTKFDLNRKAPVCVPYPNGTKMRSLFEEPSLVYVRDPELFTEFYRQRNFNYNRLDLKGYFIDKHRQKTGLVLPEISPYYKPSRNDSTLVFESRFESGNLSAVARTANPNEYNLLLQTDINSRGHTQWFYFKVTNIVQGKSVKFNILNFVKVNSLHNDGMKILYYSEHENRTHGTSWKRGGKNIVYYANGISREFNSKTYYTLSFEFTFEFNDDTIYFAYALPYTYTQLQTLLDELEADPRISKCLTRKPLCRTIAGNRCDFLTITNPGNLEKTRSRRGAVISARVHPGETVGSWMMQGVLEFLTEDSEEANQLRENYVIKVVPMLNPDGVINGNYRCSLVGADLNRRWKNPVKELHPEIYHLKRHIKSMSTSYSLDLICDLHGHSRKNNIFMYGCNYESAPEKCRLFPFILSKISSTFCFESSRFGVQKSKESTMRVSLFKELNLSNIFTLEASFNGSDKGEFAGCHYTSSMLKQMGRDLCRSLMALCQSAPESVPLKVPEVLEELLQNEEMLNVGNEECSSSGSDSEPSEDNFDVEEMRSILPKNFLKKKSSKKKPKTTAKPPYSKRPKTAAKKKCKLCGEDELPNHQCKVEETPVKKIIIGLRTYYNISGKKVHDQQTQTPIEFYPKIVKFREELQGLFLSKTIVNRITHSDSNLPPQPAKLRVKVRNEKSDDTDKSLPSVIRRNLSTEGKGINLKDLVASPRHSNSALKGYRLEKNKSMRKNKK